jgi:hypothetical protein
MAVADQRQLHPGIAQGDRQRQPRHRRRLRDRNRSRPRGEPLGQPVHARQRGRNDEAVDHSPGPTGLRASHDDVMVGHHSGVDADRDRGATLDLSHSRVLSFSRTRPPAPRPRARRRATRVLDREGPRARSPSTTRRSRRHPTDHAGSSTKGHPRLWVIRCHRPADQLPPAQRLPSIPSTESTREQNPSDDLFHEPEAQPKCVTPEVLPRGHPTRPPAQDERHPQ